MDQNTKIALEKFNKLLNKEPLDSDLKTEQNGLSIPISKLESKMDDIFGAGNWSRKTTQSYREINEFIVVCEISYIHPVTGILITRSGIGSVPIQVGAKENPLDVQKKKSKALHYNAPAAQGYAFKNAVKSIGKWFGRDILRLKKPETVALPPNNMKLESIMGCAKAIAEATSKDDIMAIFFNSSFDGVLSDPLVMNELITKKIQIEKPLKSITDGK